MADKFYPRGRIALGTGDLMDVTNIKVTTTNNNKFIHTIQQANAGIYKGNEETTVTYDAVVSDRGAERDYFHMVKQGTIKQLRIKVPGETMTVVGMYKTRSFEIPLDDAIKMSLEFIGKLQD